MQFNFNQYKDSENNIIQPYCYKLNSEDSLITTLPFGNKGGNWNFDVKNGILFFADFDNFSNSSIQIDSVFKINTNTNKPVLTFYKYIGRKGVELLNNQIIELQNAINNIDNSNNINSNNIINDVSLIKQEILDLSLNIKNIIQEDLSKLIYDISDLSLNFNSLTTSFNDFQNYVDASFVSEVSFNAFKNYVDASFVSTSYFTQIINGLDLSFVTDVSFLQTINILKNVDASFLLDISSILLQLNNLDVSYATDLSLLEVINQVNSLDLSFNAFKNYVDASFVSAISYDYDISLIKNLIENNAINESSNNSYLIDKIDILNCEDTLIKADINYNQSLIQYNYTNINLINEEIFNIEKNISTLKDESAINESLNTLEINNNKLEDEFLKSDIIISKNNIEYNRKKIELLEEVVSNLQSKYDSIINKIQEK